jgi:hypothetical protein
MKRTCKAFFVAEELPRIFTIIRQKWSKEIRLLYSDGKSYCKTHPAISRPTP